MKGRSDGEKPYSGLLGLDKVPSIIKLMNFYVTILVGGGMVWTSTIHSVTSPTIQFEFWPPSLPLIFTYGLPVGLVSLWLRLTGIRWRWGILASISALLLPFILFYIYAFVIGIGLDE